MSMIKRLGLWSIVGAILASYLALLVGKLSYEHGLLGTKGFGRIFEINSFALSIPFPNELFSILFALTNSYLLTFLSLLILDAILIFFAVKILNALSNRASIICVAIYWGVSILAFATLTPLGIVIMMGRGHP